MKGSADHLPNKLTSNIPVKKTPGSQPVHESKSESKKVTKPKPKKRPFGSIRCRACNRYGLTDQCPCSPSARYSVMIQSKRISKQHQRQIRRLSFATVKEAETFRQFIAMRSYARPLENLLCSNNFGFDASRVQNHSFPKYDSHEPCSLPEPAWDDNAYMFANKKRSMDSQLDFQPPTQRKRLGLSRECFLPMESSSANAHPIKKRSMDSQLDFQSPTQRKRLGLSRECFLPIESSSANAHPMFSPWQQGPTSARPMPQQYSRCFKSFGSAPMPMDPDASSCAMDMAATRSTMGSPHSPIDSPLAFEPNTFWDERRELNSLMMNVVSTCLAQKSMFSNSK